MTWKQGATGEEAHRQASLRMPWRQRQWCEERQAAAQRGRAKMQLLQHAETFERNRGLSAKLRRTRTQKSGHSIEMMEKWQMRHQGRGKWLLQQRVFVSFSNQLLLLAAIAHLLTPSIYYCKCQRRPSFYFSIFPGKDVVSLPSPWPCYSAAPSLTERPSLCQCLSPILPPSFFAFFLGLLHPHLPLFLFRSWQLKSAGRAACLLRGEVLKKRGAENKEQARQRIFSTSQRVSFGCLLINFVCLISRVFFSVPVLWCERDGAL